MVLLGVRVMHVMRIQGCTQGFRRGGRQDAVRPPGTPLACFTKRPYIYEQKYFGNSYKTM